MLNILTGHQAASWEDYCQTRSYQRRFKEYETRIQKIDETTLALRTYDGAYRLEMIRVSIQGWARGYRTDNPYATNFSQYTSTRDHTDAVKNLVNTALRYQYEIENFGQPLARWAKWADKQYKGLWARIA